ncbi:MAG: recombinase family protein [Candidatus Aquicultor sp.]|nr:recombinase family protein [Candidatus Aquicultor sp.]
MKQAVIYARVSSIEQEQEGFSIPSQVKALRALAIQHKHRVAAEFVESASARKEGRKKFNDMVAFIKENDVRIIFCYKPDRLSRNHGDLLAIKELITKLGVVLIFSEGGRIDTSPQGMLLLDMMISFASFQVENQALDIKRGLLEKVKQGYWPLEAPLGYRNDRNTRTVEVDEARCFYVKQIFELYATGSYSMRTIASKLFEQGFRNKKDNRIWPNGIETILKNPFYYGAMLYKGKLYPGKHKPLITKALFDAVQTMFKAKSLNKNQVAREFALRGFLTCSECGCSITAEVQKGHTYYRCTKSKGNCSQPYIREEALEREIASIFESLEHDQEMLDIIIEAVKETEEQELTRIATMRTNIESRLKKIKTDEKELLKKYLSGKVRDELYEELSGEYVQESIKLEQQMKHLSQNKTQTFELIERLLNQANSARQDFIAGSAQEKKELLSIVSSNLVLANREIVAYQLKEPFEMISKWPKTTDTQVLWR